MQIVIANKSHVVYAEEICNTIEEAAKVRGTGIAKRKPEYIISNVTHKSTPTKSTSVSCFIGYYTE